jgi:hypothetical protein
LRLKDTRSNKYWSADEISSESRQNGCSWNMSPQLKPDARASLHDNWNALSLARRAPKENFPTQSVPLKTILQNGEVFLPDPVYFLHFQVGRPLRLIWMHWKACWNKLF